MSGDERIPPANPRDPVAPPGAAGGLRSVGGYRLLRRIGEGGMSSVYLGYDVPGRRAVAVKLLAEHLAGRREYVNRFRREARFSRLLRHPNLVRGHAAGYDPAAARHYLVLEFVDGPSGHAALVRAGRLPIGAAVKVGIDIARALHFLHARNYVHRDVKPDNILLHPGGDAKLADLGLAKLLTDESHLTSVNRGVGTSYYMPCEQSLNASLVDGRSDVFALGATLYHLLTGRVPFAGSTHAEIMREKGRNNFPPVRAVVRDVPPILAEIIATTLDRDPRVRYQVAGDLAAALEGTRLATRIPAFPPPDAPYGPGDPPVDSPTRADIPTGPPAPADLPHRTGFTPPPPAPFVAARA